MKQIYRLLKFLIVVLLLLLGIPLIFMRLDEVYGIAYEQAANAYAFLDENYEELLLQLPEASREWVRPGVAALMVGTGLLIAAFSLLRTKKERSISFQGMHGKVTIELKDIESTLENVLTKLPEVKRASIRLEPTDSPGRALALADTVLIKDADDDARQVTARVQAFLQQHTKKILGLQDVEVMLTVNKWLMNMKTVKPELLLLEAPGDVAGTSEDGYGSSEASGDRVVDMPVADSDDEMELQR